MAEPRRAPDPADGAGPGGVDEEEVGTLGEETAKLLRVLAQTRQEREDGDRAAAGHVCSTGWCPVCRVVGYVREHPEVVEDMASAAVQFATSLRTVVEAAWSDPAPGDGQDGKDEA